MQNDAAQASSQTAMLRSRLILLTLITLIAFAANGLLCRMALKQTQIDPASFTAIRLASGALMLWLIVASRRGIAKPGGSWPSALALFGYAAPFSFAYVWLPAGTGALLLFGAVQSSMILYGFYKGERFNVQQSVGLFLALGGLVYLMLPGIEAPPLGSSLLMVTAGVSWGVYSLRGRRTSSPLVATAGNFLRAAMLGIVLGIAALPWVRMDLAGTGYALASGMLASGMGYAIWYTILPALRATTAATLQLSVPVIIALGGVVLIEEPITLRLVLASIIILGGIGLTIWTKPHG